MVQAISCVLNKSLCNLTTEAQRTQRKRFNADMIVSQCYAKDTLSFTKKNNIKKCISFENPSYQIINYV